MFQPYFLKNLEIKPSLVLAPMSGITTSSFRRLVRELNSDSLGLVLTEFISVEGLTRKSRRSVEMLRFHSSERPVGIQIFGYDITRMREAALMAQDTGADLVDINCGCPAPKVVRKGGGCELMRQPEHLANIFREVRRVIKIPLTAKFRSGWDENSKNVLEVARIAEQEGLDAIAVHGRTRAQMYRGQSDWELIGRVAAAAKVPVLGSGDVVDRGSALARLERGVSGLFVGRAALSNPFVFTEIVGGKSVGLRSRPGLMVKTILRYMELLREEFSAPAALGKVKQLVSQMCRGYPWRLELVRATSLEDQLRILERVRDEQLALGSDESQFCAGV